MEKLKINMQVDSDEKILDMMYQAYTNCPAAKKYLANLSLSDEQIKNNITKIYDMVSDINYCSKCQGIGKCQKNNPLLCTKIVVNNGIIDRELVPCKKFLERVTFENQFLIRDFNEEWLTTSIKDIDQSEPRKLAMAKYIHFIKEGKNDWMYLTGGPSSGRSFLASALCVDAAKKGRGPIIFMNALQRFRELCDLSYKDKEKFQFELERYSNVPILVIDDFANEFKNDYIRDSIVFPILSTRASKKLFTIITSDFEINDVVTLYSTSKAGEIRAKQLGKILKVMSSEEINLGDLAIYQ